MTNNNNQSIIRQLARSYNDESSKAIDLIDISEIRNDQISYGTFGDVRLCISCSSDSKLDLAVIKTIRNALVTSSPCSLKKDVFNEIISLQHLGSSHENICPLLRVMNGSCSSISLAFPFCPVTVLCILQESTKEIPRNIIQTLAFDLLKGVAYCHDKGIIHNDIKPSNLLISSRGVLQLADFGIAKPCASEEFLDEAPSGLCTLQYRAPELLLNQQVYYKVSDVWSCAIVILELITLEFPFFDGTSVLDQLSRLFQVFGTPTNDNTLAEYPDFQKFQFQIYQKIPALSHVVAELNSEQGLTDLLHQMLTLDPKERALAKACVNHSWFQALEPCHEEIVLQYLHPMGLLVPQLLPNLDTAKSAATHVLTMIQSRRNKNRKIIQNVTLVSSNGFMEFIE